MMYSHKLKPGRPLTHPSDPVYNNGYDNEHNDYILRVNDIIVSPEGKEYTVHQFLGKGTFGQVALCS